MSKAEGSSAIPWCLSCSNCLHEILGASGKRLLDLLVACCLLLASSSLLLVNCYFLLLKVCTWTAKCVIKKVERGSTHTPMLLHTTSPETCNTMHLLVHLCLLCHQSSMYPGRGPKKIHEFPQPAPTCCSFVIEKQSADRRPCGKSGRSWYPAVHGSSAVDLFHAMHLLTIAGPTTFTIAACILHLDTRAHLQA